MDTSVLSFVDRLTQKLGPISAALDATVAHLVPQKTASACSGILCYTLCNFSCHNGFYNVTQYYSTSPTGCKLGGITCQNNILCPPDGSAKSPTC
jgi:hypothetical protein